MSDKEKRGRCQMNEGEQKSQIKNGVPLRPCVAKGRREKINCYSPWRRELGWPLGKDNPNMF